MGMKKQTPAAKKVYSKPELTRIRLAPSEAVLGNCKSSSTVGPAQGACDLPTSCYTSGS